MKKYFNCLNLYGLFGCSMIFSGSVILGKSSGLGKIHLGSIIIIGIGILIVGIVLGFARARINTLEKRVEKQ